MLTTPFRFSAVRLPNGEAAMITGRQALNSIEAASAKVRSDEMHLDAALRSASEEAARLRQQRLKELHALAELKFHLIQKGELIRDLDAAEQQAKNLLDRIRREINDVETRRQEATKALQELEILARERSEAYDASANALRAFKEQIAPSITSDPVWLALNAKVESASKVAGEADKKATQAEADRARKKVPYEGDPLFMYLWRRKYGTSEYSSGFFVRYFDSKIATLINYRGARANYAMLNQIPERLRDHANRVGAEFLAIRQQLAAFEQERLIAAGGGPLQSKVAEAKVALDKAEAEVQEASQRLESLDKQYDAIALQDNSGAFTKAIELMAENDSRDDVRTLYREAARTKTDQDRIIVEKIDKLTQSIARADDEIIKLRDQIREIAARRTEIERARREFRQRGYDYPGTTFGNETTINDVLGGILEGAMKGIVLGQVLQQGYRRPPVPDWGGSLGPGPIFPPSRPLPGPSVRPPDGGFRTGGSF
jgi:chromosome segregation ATPase